MLIVGTVRPSHHLQELCLAGASAGDAFQPRASQIRSFAWLEHLLGMHFDPAQARLDETSNSDAAESARTGYVASRAVDGSGYGMSDLVRLFLLPLAFRQRISCSLHAQHPLSARSHPGRGIEAEQRMKQLTLPKALQKITLNICPETRLATSIPDDCHCNLCKEQQRRRLVCNKFLSMPFNKQTNKLSTSNIIQPLRPTYISLRSMVGSSEVCKYKARVLNA
uniref:Uncharacterized protein n=1 Tax=Ascaris lumbricoides TaxID=6252 RepID=A0A0M3ID24_ASCLU